MATYNNSNTLNPVGTSGGSFTNSYQLSAFDNLAASGDYTKPQLESMYVGLAGSGSVVPTEGTSWWEDTKSGLGNKDFMSGAMGLGQLGLGLANYLSMKPVYEEQLKGLKQNREFAAADQTRQDTSRSNFQNIKLKAIT